MGDRKNKPNNEVGGHARVGALTVLMLAVWFGVLAGSAEVVLLGILKLSGLAAAGKSLGLELGWRTGFVWLSPQVVWMAPVFAVCQLALVGVGFVIVSKLKPSLSVLPIIVVLYAFVAYLSLLLVYHRLYDIAAVLLAAGLAVQTGRIVNRRPEAFLIHLRKWTGWMAVAPVAIAVVLNVGFAAAERIGISRLATPDPNSPNVLLLILDTVRASNVSLYGYERETTPNLKRLANQGVVFDRAIATAPWTLPSHVSIFTGRLPGDVSASFFTPYDGKYATLAEVLSEHGYRTAGFVANRLYLGYEAGVGRGFQRYDDYSLSLSEFVMSSGLGRRVVHSPTLRRMFRFYDILGRKNAAGVTQGFFRWMNGHSTDRPFFAFLNFNDAHEPYLPPQPYSTKFGRPFQRRNDRSLFEMRRVVRTDRAELSQEGVQAEEDAYDGAINYVDEQVGLVLDRLRQENQLDNTVVIVASDHGEHFGEHGLHVHGNSVFMPVLHVPLIVAYGDRIPAGSRVTDPVSIRDIPATVLALSGFPNEGRLAGTSLARFWADADRGNDVSGGNPVVSEYTDVTGNISAKSVVLGRYHYFWGWGHVHLVHPETGEEAWRDVQYEALYDIDTDPDERRDLASDSALVDVVADARGVLVPYLLRDPTYRNYLPTWAYETAPGSTQQPIPR